MPDPRVDYNEDGEPIFPWADYQIVQRILGEVSKWSGRGSWRTQQAAYIEEVKRIGYDRMWESILNFAAYVDAYNLWNFRDTPYARDILIDKYGEGAALEVDEFERKFFPQRERNWNDGTLRSSRAQTGNRYWYELEQRRINEGWKNLGYDSVPNFPLSRIAKSQLRFNGRGGMPYITPIYNG